MALLSVLVPPATANVIYTYTGNPYSAPGSVYNGAQLYATFTLASAVPASSTTSGAQPLAFLVSDGFITMTDQSPNTTMNNFSLGTDASGNITDYYYDVFQPLAGPGTTRGFTSSSQPTALGHPPGFDEAYTIDFGRVDQIFVYGSGSWTVTSDNAAAGAPEPATFGLFGSAMLLAGFARKSCKRALAAGGRCRIRRQ